MPVGVRDEGALEPDPHRWRGQRRGQLGRRGLGWRLLRGAKLLQSNFGKKWSAPLVVMAPHSRVEPDTAHSDLEHDDDYSACIVDASACLIDGSRHGSKVRRVFLHEFPNSGTKRGLVFLLKKIIITEYTYTRLSFALIFPSFKTEIQNKEHKKTNYPLGLIPK